MATALDKDVPVPLDPDVQFFNYMADAFPWLDRKFGIDLMAAMHRRDLERAGQPPVINVHVEGVPGVFTKTAGSAEAAYVPELPAEE
jgi:hypothetical protein